MSQSLREKVARVLSESQFLGTEKKVENLIAIIREDAAIMADNHAEMYARNIMNEAESEPAQRALQKVAADLRKLGDEE